MQSRTSEAGNQRALSSSDNGIVKLHLDLCVLEPARMTHNLLMRLACEIPLDIGFALPFRVGDEFTASAAQPQQLFRDAARLPNHQWRTFSFPNVLGALVLGRGNPDMDQPDDGHQAASARGMSVKTQYDPRKFPHRVARKTCGVVAA